MSARRRPGAVLAVVAGVLALHAPAGEAMGEGRSPAAEVDPSTLLVRFASDAAAARGTSVEGDVLGALTAGGARIVRLQAGGRIDDKLAAYRRHAGVVYAEPNYVRRASLEPPDDPSVGRQWGLDAVHALGGWEIYPGLFGASLSGPEIAVVDTGVDLLHPDLAGKLDTAAAVSCLSGVCSSSSSVQDGNGHGTHVAGIAAATTGNGIGIAGLALTSRLQPVKVLTTSGTGTDAGIAAGIDWAVSHGARVVNLSLGGGGGFPTTLCGAVVRARAAGAVVVAAAGNSGSSSAVYPAACPGAIGVAATDATGGTPSWSNYGSPDVFVSAPGASIYSTHWASGSTYATISGTSMAAPAVAGLAALLLAQVPSRTPADVASILASTAKKLGTSLYGDDPYATCAGCTWSSHYGYGQIDVAAALAFGVPPALDAASPLVARTGSMVTLTGEALGAGVTDVSLGNVLAAFMVVSPTEIAATVPVGVAYGRWRVTKAAGTAVSALVATVSAPAIASFSPVLGPAGSTVTITGSGFEDVADVTYGFVPAAFTVVSPTEIEATVPDGVAYGRWRVASPLWTAAHPRVHTATAGPRPFTLSAWTGPAGGTVTLSAPGLGRVTGVSLGFVPAPFTRLASSQIVATVPPGVAYGRWRIATPSGVSVDDVVFTVAAPVIASFSPMSGPEGSTVTIVGSGFDDVTHVSYGFVPARFTVISPTEIEATVPNGVAYGRWRVTSPLWTADMPIVHTTTG
jgi:subtilisin family serine protease